MGGIKIELKNIFKAFLITIIVIVSLNFAYADSGPTIGENQAKITAQDYLNSHNLHYTALTPNDDSWRVKVKDTTTGEVKWITFTEYKSDMYEHSGDTERYNSIENVPTVWIVQVNDNLKNVGNIYIASETGEILKVVINGKVLENVMGDGNQVNGTSNDNTSDTTNQIPQNTLYTPITLVIVSILIIAGAGYWFKIRK